MRRHHDFGRKAPGGEAEDSIADRKLRDRAAHLHHPARAFHSNLHGVAGIHAKRNQDITEVEPRGEHRETNLPRADRDRFESPQGKAVQGAGLPGEQAAWHIGSAGPSAVADQTAGPPGLIPEGDAHRVSACDHLVEQRVRLVGCSLGIEIDPPHPDARVFDRDDVGQAPGSRGTRLERISPFGSSHHMRPAGYDEEVRGALNRRRQHPDRRRAGNRAPARRPRSPHAVHCSGRASATQRRKIEIREVDHPRQDRSPMSR